MPALDTYPLKSLNFNKAAISTYLNYHHAIIFARIIPHQRASGLCVAAFGTALPLYFNFTRVIN